MPRKRTDRDPKPENVVLSGHVAPVVVTQIPVEGASVFRTVVAEHPAWEPDGCKGWVDKSLAGAFVRVQPPPDATDADVEAVRAWVLESGAVAVRVQPRLRHQVIVQVAREERARGGIRAVVQRMVDEANSTDREALAVLVEAALAAAGV